MATATRTPTDAPLPPRAPAPGPPRSGLTVRVRRAVRHLGPNWYATVMGTAILASAGAELTGRLPGLRPLWVSIWSLSLLVLVLLSAARSLHWRHHRDRALAQLDDPAAAPFYGCLAMALLAVGGGAVGVGRDVLGEGVAVGLGLLLFVLGTAVGLVVAVGVPYRLVVGRGAVRVTPVWLLVVVAPVVSAATGPLFVPHLPAGAGEGLLFGSFALLGVGLLGTLVLLPSVFAGLVADGPPAPALTPTLFLVLGPLGQSTTALGRLADAAPAVTGPGLADGFGVLAVWYGVPVMGFALLWLALATALVVRARHRGMRFSMTWWAFTFPVGTCVTGAAELADRTGWGAYAVVAALLGAGLAAAWTVVAARTVLELVRGRLPAPPR
ncbi:C4-dicarboxylate ABC transporter [Streptomyces sp. NPDC127068]|uniref:SLAC1 family transporter n=1 Tax=Streptomyces sp. NPDC127068 TaxID=3347127 RepID=UPI00364C1116